MGLDRLEHGGLGGRRRRGLALVQDSPDHGGSTRRRQHGMRVSQEMRDTLQASLRGDLLLVPPNAQCVAAERHNTLFARITHDDGHVWQGTWRPRMSPGGGMPARALPGETRPDV